VVNILDLPRFIVDEPRLLILGADKCGKTSLAPTVYRLLQSEPKLVPLLLDGQNIVEKARISTALDGQYVRQYSDATLERFKQLLSSRRALIIDNFDAAPVRRHMLGDLVEHLCSWFDKIIILADDFYEIDHVVNAKDHPILFDFRQYHIEELNRVLRSKLIERG
jgi:hypothetical protein